MAPHDEVARSRATSYSMCLAGALMGAPRRGVVHSAFAVAANLVFPGDLVISLNADAHTAVISTRALPFPGMPNGIQVDGFPFAALRPGMPVLLGAGRVVIDAIGCSLDLSDCAQWDARIARPANLDVKLVRKHAAWLERQYLAAAADDDLLAALPGAINRLLRLPVAEMARALCGRGRGLTPAGDDMLAGWMAINWLLYGPPPYPVGAINLAPTDGRGPEVGGAMNCAATLVACREILEVARRQTHLLSQSWLGYAARGCVALPVRTLLEAMAGNDERQLAAAAQVVLSMGATSGHDLMRGIVMGIRWAR